MEFKVGDKILLKKEKQRGVVVKINSLYKVQIETPEGFKVNVSVKDIILINVFYFLTFTIWSNNSSITIGETPAVGSSNIKTVGLIIKALPSATCCLCPPDNSPTN